MSDVLCDQTHVPPVTRPTGQKIHLCYLSADMWLHTVRTHWHMRAFPKDKQLDFPAHAPQHEQHDSQTWTDVWWNFFMSSTSSSSWGPALPVGVVNSSSLSSCSTCSLKDSHRRLNQNHLGHRWIGVANYCYLVPTIFLIKVLLLLLSTGLWPVTQKILSQGFFFSFFLYCCFCISRQRFCQAQCPRIQHAFFFFCSCLNEVGNDKAIPVAGTVQYILMSTHVALVCSKCFPDASHSPTHTSIHTPAGGCWPTRPGQAC